MHWLLLLFGLSAAWPLTVAWRNTRGSTIRHPLAWAWIAWATWLWYGWHGGPIAAYGALTLTAAAGIAVFGARRPGVVAWHFVVIGLLAVLWLPWAESFAQGGEIHMGGFRSGFLIALLAVTSLNYFPTRGCFGALSLILACEYAGMTLTICAPLRSLVFSERVTAPHVCAIVVLGFSIWQMWIMTHIGRRGSPTDQLWSRFRDRFGAVWALRLREQFNAAAQNAGWPVRLGWYGLTPKTDQVDPAWHEALVALQKRFGTM